MSQTQILHRRIRSVKNAKQITKAMEVVAASRMRRIAEAAAKTQAYGLLAKQIVARISVTEEARHNRYFKSSGEGKTLYVIFTSDRGLAGAYNSNVFNSALEAFVKNQQTNGRPSVIVFGKKGARFFSRFEGIDLIGEYEDTADVPPANLFAPILEAIANGLAGEHFTGVQAVYTKFNSAMNQSVQVQQLLPITVEQNGEGGEEIPKLAYEFEPSINQVIDEAVRLYLEASFMVAKVDASASEYAMRMMAMGSANRNASDLIDDLTLELNASRQAAITAEIAEISVGAEAVK